MKLLIDSCVFIDAFDTSSLNHSASLKLLNDLKKKNIQITMPAHGWFEVQCTFQNMSNQGRFTGPKFQGDMNYPIELIHIDDEFISKYSMTEIPYIKAGDHIFVVVAKKNGYPLVTSDNKMYEVANKAGVKVFTPAEYSNEIA